MIGVGPGVAAGWLICDMSARVTRTGRTSIRNPVSEVPDGVPDVLHCDHMAD